MLLDVLFWGLKASPLLQLGCSYGGRGISKFLFLIKKYLIFFYFKFFKFLIPGSGSGLVFSLKKGWIRIRNQWARIRNNDKKIVLPTLVFSVWGWDLCNYIFKTDILQRHKPTRSNNGSAGGSSGQGGGPPAGSPLSGRSLQPDGQDRQREASRRSPPRQLDVQVRIFTFGRDLPCAFSGFRIRWGLVFFQCW